MKKILSLLLMLIISKFALSQETVAASDVIEQFLKTKTCVVLDNSLVSAYNRQIKDAINSSWTITPFEFIEYEEFKKRQNDPQYSFLLKTKDVYKADSDKMTYSFLSLILGGKYGSVFNAPCLCAFPLSYYGVDADSYLYKMNAIIKFFIKHIELTKSNPKLTEKNILAYYNSHTTKLSNQTLYLKAEECAKEVNTQAKIKQVYSKPFKLSNEDELENLIDNATPNTVFLHKVGPEKGSKAARCFNIIMGTNGEVYYVDFHRITPKTPDGFLLSDFKKLNK